MMTYLIIYSLTIDNADAIVGESICPCERSRDLFSMMHEATHLPARIIIRKLVSPKTIQRLESICLKIHYRTREFITR